MNDPVKIKEQIVELKEKIAADVIRSKKRFVPSWLKERQQKREQQLQKLESLVR